MSDPIELIRMGFAIAAGAWCFWFGMVVGECRTLLKAAKAGSLRYEIRGGKLVMQWIGGAK